MPLIRKNTWRLRAVWLVAALAATLVGAALGRVPQFAEARPNIVVIQTDDQTSRMLHSTWIDRQGHRHPTMPNTLRLIAGQGLEFTNYYASIPVCSPSRSALLSGQYGHTSGLIRNLGRLGGARGISLSDVWEGNIAAALRQRGYRTAHFGRFVNEYGNESGYADPATPPGWTNWATDWTPGPVRRFYGYKLNVNGKIEGPFGRANYQSRQHKDPVRCPAGGLKCNYHTDQIATRAIREIRTRTNRPLYMQVDFEAPHGAPEEGGAAEPASRHIGTASRTKLPRPPGFNEVDIRDKPRALRAGSRRLSPVQVEAVRQKWIEELETLRSVDQSVGRIIRNLAATGRLANTFVFFISDNGAFFGEHRYAASKFLAYEPATNLPLLVRGPGVKKGRKSGAIVSNVDLAPTFARLAGARLLLPPDGRSIKPLFRHPRRVGRRAVVIESYRLPSRALYSHLEAEGVDVPDDLGASSSAVVPAVNYTALRAGRYKYIQYEGGGRELYDLKLDPGEVSNRIHWKGYRRVVRIFERQIKWRRFCSGRTCRRGTGKLPVPVIKRRKHPSRPHLRGL